MKQLMNRMGIPTVSSRWCGATCRSYRNLKKQEVVVQLWKMFLSRNLG